LHKPVFALGLRSADGRTEFLRRGFSYGNLMRTDHPAYAHVWPSQLELQRWVDELPESAADQIRGRQMLWIPIRFDVGKPTKIITFATEPPPLKPPDGGQPAATTEKKRAIEPQLKFETED
jgi:hypothetical protein